MEKTIEDQGPRTGAGGAFPDDSGALLPRLLSSIDRGPYSPLRGCADRLYWGWKMSAYPDASLQRAAFLFHRLNEGGAYDGIIEAMLEFTSRIQHRDGSFDQAFPGEHSHGAAAFILSDLAQILLERPEFRTRHLGFLVRAGDFLVKHEETHALISNHIAGACAALYKLHALTSEKKYLERARYYLGRVLGAQSGEGWFPEYGGADPGYQTLAVSYLAEAYRISKEEKILRSMESSFDFISYFCHPDESFGGEYGSRNTEIFYPRGAAMLAEKIPAAQRLLRWCVSAYAGGKTVTPLSMDTQNLAPLWSCVLDAGREARRTEPGEASFLLPFERPPFIKDFPEAGIRIVNTEKIYAVIAWKKGGVIKAFGKETGEKILHDSGAAVCYGKNLLGTVQKLSTLHEAVFSKDTVTVVSPVFKLDQPVPRPWKMSAVRFFASTAGRIPALREWMKKALVRFVVTRQKRLPGKVERTISFTGAVPKISDRLLEAPKQARLFPPGEYTALHMASSQYAPGRSP